MIVRSLTLHDDAKKIVSLNNAGECTVVQLQIDAAEFLAEYPGCGIELLIENPQGVVYRRTPERDGNMLLYTVKKTDTLYPGYGVMQLYAKGASGEERLSNKWRTYIAPSLLLEEVTEPPAPIAPMIEEVENIRDEAKSAAARASESEQSAGGYAQQAENSAGEAAESATSAAANAEKAENAANRAETATGEIKNLSANAQTLEPGTQATADYANGMLTLGIPRGQDGAPGAPGSDASVTADNIQAALGYTPVKDVQLDGESLVQDSVATIPLAGYNRLGVVKLDPAGFAAASIEGKLALVPPTDAQISTHTHTQRPITPSCMDYAVKAAMCDGKGAAWTANEQKAARERMGVDKAYELIESITTDGTAIVEREAEPNETPYNFSHVIVVVTSPKNMESESTLYAHISTGDANQYAFAVFPKNVAYFRRTMYSADIRNGILSYASTVAVNVYGDLQDQGNTDVGNIAKSPTLKFTSNNIKKIQVTGAKATAVPAGFLIQIYGVRVQ